MVRYLNVYFGELCVVFIIYGFMVYRVYIYGNIWFEDLVDWVWYMGGIWRIDLVL